MRFDNFKVSKDNVYAYKQARKWANDYKLGNSGLTFYGPTGTGKTHLACACANYLIRVLDIYVLFMSTVRIPKHDTNEVLRYTDPAEVPVLILDDFGAEKLTERALECLYILIDGRLWTNATTIVTTNYIEEKLRLRLEDYGDRLVGRIREGTMWVPVGGRDHRLV